ncbi:TonB-dependent siderophore receptor [Cereibacter sphaeroides]|nr:TonB-dependent siderophore receptor [Cereibacter sphaeroides]
MRANRLMGLLGSTALMGLVAAPLSAQEAEDFQYLGQLRFSILGAEPISDQVDPLTLTGVLTPTPLTEVPQSISVVSSEQIARRNLGKLDEALQYTAGVQAAPYAYDSDTNWVFLRGYDATQTGMFMDGSQLLSYGFGSFYIDPFLVERVEVLRGPSSMVYGSSNPGGVVNFVSRLPTDTEGTVAEIGATSQGRAWVSVDSNHHLDENTALRFGARVQRTDGYGTFAPGTTALAFAALTHRFENGGTLTVAANYTDMDETHVGGTWLPYEGTVTDAPFGRFGEYFNTGEPGFDSYDRQQAMVTAIWRQDIADGWTLNNTFRWGRAHVREQMVYAYGYAGYSLTPTDPDGTLSRLVFAHDSLTTVLSNDLHVTGQFATGEVDHTLVAGLDARRYQLDQVQASATGTGLTSVDPIYGAPQPAPVPYLDQEITQQQVGLYLQDQMRFGEGWMLTMNGRYDWVSTTSTRDAATGVAGVDRSDREFSWRLGLSRQIGAFTPYATLGTYFNPQIVANPAGNAIVPESGHQAEIGLRWSPDDSTLFSIAAFDIRRENVSLDQYDWATGSYYYYQIGEIRSRGVELEYRGRLTDSLTLEASATLLDAEILADLNPAIVGNTPMTVAETQASLMLSWQPASIEGLTLSGGLRYTGASWVDNENSARVPGRTLVDLGARYDFEGGWSANMFITNLLDRDYVASCNSAYWCYQGEGRNVSLTLTRSF